MQKQTKDILTQVVIASSAFLVLRVANAFLPSPKPLFYWLYAIYFLAFIYCLIRRNHNFILANAVVLMLLLVATETNLYARIAPGAEAVKLHVLFGEYQVCKSTAVAIDAETALGVCDIYDRGAYYDGIVYDSSDNIMLSQNEHSDAWRNAARHQKATAVFDQMEYDAVPIGQHFYYVTFHPGRPPTI